MAGGACGTHRTEKDSGYFLLVKLKERESAKDHCGLNILHYTAVNGGLLL